jgi:hypothetical protein
MVIGMVSVLMATATSSQAAEQTTPCDPACGAGATCVEGVCMIPAPSAAPTAAPAAPPPAATPSPSPAYPPPGYPPPPRYGYQPPPAVAPGHTPLPSTARIARHGQFLALPFLGMSTIKGGGNPSTDPGLRAGALLGGRVNEMFSLNVELGGDVINEPASALVSEYVGYLAFSPLVHFAAPGIELALGPKLGLWGLTGGASSGGTNLSESGYGWVYGINAGFFIPVSDGASLGALFSYAVDAPSQLCVSVTGSGQQCLTANLNDIKVLGLTLALLL